MYAKYPNLELLEYKTRKILEQDKTFNKAIKDVNVGIKLTAMNVKIEAKMFIQIWGDTSCGIDIDSKGNPYIAGQAFTDAYTTVFYENYSKQYFVYFDERLAYIITKANTKFLSDLKDCNLLCVSEAKKKY